MNIDVTQSSGVAVVVPRGDLDMAAVPDVRNALTGLLDNGQSRLLIDLDDVGYIDSSGMGTLIAAMKQARAAGGDVRLCGLQGGRAHHLRDHARHAGHEHPPDAAGSPRHLAVSRPPDPPSVRRYTTEPAPAPRPSRSTPSAVS